MIRRMIIMLLLLAVVLGGIFWGRSWLFNTIGASYRVKPPPTPVSVVTVKEVQWHPSISAVGTLTAVHGVNLSAELSGQLKAIAFKNGQMVKKGQLLVQLDDAADQQELNNLRAQLTLAKTNYDRQLSLYKTGAVSPSDFDETKAKLKQVAAMVKKQEALLGMKRIVAPFAGRVGIRQVNEGEYVSPGTELVTLQTLDPLYVQFSIPEQNIPNLHVGQKVKINVDSAGKRDFYGAITAINAAVDVKTRSILIQATVPNRDFVLYPGSFASIHVLLPARSGMLAIPQTAINYTLYGDTVFVLQRKGKAWIATQKNVTLGMRQGDQVAVVSGLRPGDQVVTVGQLRIHNGASVSIVMDAPQPKDATHHRDDKTKVKAIHG